MFLTLLAVTFLIAAACSVIVARLFDRPIATMFGRTVSDELAGPWQRYIKFAVYVVGIAGGVRVWQLEKYLEKAAPALTRDRWVLEIYRTIIGTLQSVAWLLLVVFLVALIAFVIVRAFERGRATPPSAAA